MLFTYRCDNKDVNSLTHYLIMNWIRFLLIFLLAFGFGLSQMDQVVDLGWLVSANFLSEEIDNQGLREDKDSQFDEKPISNLRVRLNRICQLRNPLSALFPFFWATVLFRRPPPGFQTLLRYF